MPGAKYDGKYYGRFALLWTMVNYMLGGEYKHTSVAIILMVGDKTRIGKI